MNKTNDNLSEWSEDGDGEWDDIDELSYMNEVNLHNKYSIPKNEFTLYDNYEIDSIIMKKIVSLSEILGNVNLNEVYHLLLKHKWKIEGICEDFFQNGCYFTKLKTNFKKIAICMVCYDDINPKQQLTVCNEHIFCKTCWKGYLISKINDGCINICCMDHKCKKKVTRDFITNNFENCPITLKYNRWFRRSFIKNTDTFNYCPNVHCSLTVCNYGTDNRINCNCGTTFCFKCLNVDHYPATCSIIGNWLSKCNKDSQNALWLMNNTKNCPKCKLSIEKNDGCNHMTCMNCKHQFCWLCKGSWKEHGSATGGFYKCNKFIEMQKKGETVDETYEQSRFLHYYSRYLTHGESKKFLEKKNFLIESMLDQQLTKEMVNSITFANNVRNSIKLILECRKTLKNSYPIGFSMEHHPQLELFEYWQEDLEKHCEKLNSLIEVKYVNKLWENRMDIANYQRITKKYHKNLCVELSNLELN